MIAALSAWHELHDAAASALEQVTALPAHVAVEAYAVLTRLPAGMAVPPESAGHVLATRFDGAPLRVDAAVRATLLQRLAGAGVFGGATYDGLVALEAHSHGHELLTLDARAQQTYRRLGVPFRVIEG